MSGAWLRRRPARVPAWVVDAGWAMVVGVAVTIAIRVAREPGARPPDLLAYALGGRSLPCWFVAGPIVVRIFVDPEPALTVLGEVVRDASLWLATLLLGALTREHRLLEVERARSERLLDNMLPEPIAERLKQQEGVIADAFGEVTVLSADIVGFTAHAERASAEATVVLLNDLFSRFDALVEARGLEKIKTVGDAYMVAGGLPHPMADHAGAVAELALEMLEAAIHRRFPDEAPVRLRVGIGSGPVVAGVIGRRRFSYDLWGDTVNTASRMETTGVPGCVQVTARTRDLLGERYRFQERGQLQVKGKGRMTTYLLSGRVHGHDHTPDLTAPHQDAERDPGEPPWPR